MNFLIDGLSRKNYLVTTVDIITPIFFYSSNQRMPSSGNNKITIRKQIYSEIGKTIKKRVIIIFFKKTYIFFLVRRC